WLNPGAREHEHVWLRSLQVWHIHQCFSVLSRAIALNDIAGYAHNRERLRVCTLKQLNARSHHRLRGRVLSDKRLVDDGDRRGGSVIEVVEVSAGNDTRFHRVEVSRTDAHSAN